MELNVYPTYLKIIFIQLQLLFVSMWTINRVYRDNTLSNSDYSETYMFQDIHQVTAKIYLNSHLSRMVTFLLQSRKKSQTFYFTGHILCSQPPAISSQVACPKPDWIKQALLYIYRLGSASMMSVNACTNEYEKRYKSWMVIKVLKKCNRIKVRSYKCFYYVSRQRIGI